MTNNKLGRRHDIDALRVFSFGTVIIYHASLLYDSKAWGHDAGWANKLMDLIAIGSHPWRMCLLFFISGLVTATLLNKKTIEDIRKSRTRQLLVPFLVGIFVVVPPQIYFTAPDVDPGTSYWEFWKNYMLSGLRLEHMWFLAYLWIYVFIWSFLWPIISRSWPELSSRFAAALKGANLFVLPVLFFAVLRIWLYPVFGESLVITTDVYAHIMYFSMFLAGVLLCNEPRFWQEIDRQRWISLGLVVVSFLIIAIVVTILPREQRPDALVVVLRILRSILQWSAIIALLAFAGRMVHGPNRVITYLNNSILTYYVLHQTIIVIIAYHLAKNGIFSVGFFVPIIIVTVFICFVSAEAKKLMFRLAKFSVGKLVAGRKASPKSPSPEAVG
ncbi:acyltransferase family protein [Rhizobium panacihumi]|uniref:acyltransferase family protein n=1 Tax=Rhizobium panacihumi TaxID=2008450 RepID=UPI003D79DAEA